MEMDDQVDGPATADSLRPVHELDAGDREHTLGSVPSTSIVAIELSATERQDGFQGDGAQALDLVWLPEGHGGSCE